MCETLKNYLLAIVNAALGVLAGIALHRWHIKRRGIEDFAAAVSDEIRELSKRPDNIDDGLVTWHSESIRRLEAFSLYLRTSEQRTWKTIQKEWDEYCLDGKQKNVATYLSVSGRKGLMDRISTLLYALRKA